MIALAIGVSLLLGFALRAHPRIAIGICLTVWIALPATALPSFWRTGGTDALHPASLIALSTLLWVAIDNPRALRRVWQTSMPGVPLLVFCGLGILLTELRSGSGLNGISTNQVFAAIAVFLLVQTIPKIELRPIALYFIALAVAESVLAVAQGFTHRSIFFEGSFATAVTSTNGTSERWMGTLDHPLVLAAFASMAIGLTATIKSVALRLTCIALLLVGSFEAQSRTGLIVGLVAALVIISTSPMQRSQRVGALAVCVVSICVGVIAFQYTGLAARFSDAGTGSNLDRGLAYSTWGEIAPDYFAVGSGPGSSYSAATSLGLFTSFENPFLMYWVDYGGILTVLYFATQAYLVAQVALRRRWVAALTVGLGAIVLEQSFSSVAANSAMGFLIWTAVGLSASTSDNRAASDTIENSNDSPHAAASDALTRHVARSAGRTSR